MSECCSIHCKTFDKCSNHGYIDWMKVLPIRPEDQPNKNWCGSYVETKES